MAPMGYVRSALVMATTVCGLWLITPGTAVAGDGPGAGDRDVTVIVSPAGLPATQARETLPPGTLQPLPGPKTVTGTTLLSDGFEGSFPGATWQIYHPSGAPNVDWGKSTYRKSAGSASIWCAAAGSASPGPGGMTPVNMESWAIAGPFDLSSATSGELRFDLWLSTESEYDDFKWLASTDGLYYRGLQTSTSTTGFETVTADLADWGSAGNLLGQAQVWIAFIYKSDVSNRYEGAYVDQVSLSVDGGGGNCGTYVLSSDNDNNSWGGSPDGDWGYCLYNNDPKHPIEFHFDVAEPSVSSAQLLLLCYDVDQYTEPGNPEIDRVYVNGTYVGDLTGANNEDSTTFFTLPTGAVSPGRNRVKIEVNQNPGAPPDEWCVELKQAQLIVNGGCTGQASCRSVSTNRSSYAPGETVAVTYEVDTSASSQQVRVESNLLDPTGVIVAGTDLVYTTTGSSNDPKTVNLALPAAAAAGTYTAQVLVFDGPSGQLESSCEAAFTVTGGGGTCNISCSASVPSTAQVGQPVTFTGNATPSGDCAPIEYFWFPEQGYSTATIQARTGSWVYNAPGTYTWLFVVIGANGARCERTGTITVTGGGSGCSLTCSATVPATAQVGQTVNLNGSATASGNCEPIEYYWFPEQGYSTLSVPQRNATWIYNEARTYDWMFVALAGDARCERTGSINVTGGGGTTTTTWIPVVSRATGANNSIWRTDVGIFNPGTATANVTVRIYVSTGTLTRTITVAPGGQRVISDVIGWIDPNLFTSAAVAVVSTQTLVVTSRTYNRFVFTDPCFPGGTLGQFLGGWITTNGLSTGQSGWLPHMVENASFRTNIGYTNTGTAAASLTVRLYNGDGVQVGTYTVNLNPGQWKQASQPFRNVAGQSNLQGGSARITVTSGSGVVVYGSVIDNVTNDPTTITMIR